MKKLILLLAGGLLATASNAQQASQSVVFTRNGKPSTIAPSRKNALVDRFKGAKTTTNITSGWFNYVDSVFTPGVTAGSVSEGISTMYMWPDTTAIFGYNDAGTLGSIGYDIPSTGYSYDVSIGMLFEPFAYTWPEYTTTLPNVALTNAYTIDSVLVVGIYGRPAAATYTDSLRFSFVQGNTSGAATNNTPIGYFSDATLLGWYNLGSPDSALWFPQFPYDSTNNIGTGASTAGTYYSFGLGAADTNTFNLGSYAFPVNFPVTAGNFAAASLSFRTGSTFPALGDSITSEDGSTFYYGSFQPIVAFAEVASSGTIKFPYYDGPEPGLSSNPTGDLTTGYFKTLGYNDAGWAGQYVPNWALDAGSGGAYYEQMPYMWFHISCPTCVSVNATPVIKNLINSVKAYPNPASSELTVSFDLSAANDVTVTLTNMVGQTVAVQTVNNVSNGIATFNTTSLPEGVYIYTLVANGTRSIGQVVVAH